MKKIIFMILSINTILLGNEIHLSSTTITTTSGLNTPLVETNKNITLITKEDISKKQYNNVEAILRDTPNIVITNTQFGPTINLRGSGERSMSRVKVMIDGINLTPLEESMGSLPLNSIPVSSIEKIEIIPGGGAALYGSGTTGGVINIITLADSRKDFISADLKGGSYYNKNLDFSIGQNINDNLYLSLATQYSNKEGYRENENSENKSFNGTLDYIINEKHRIKFQGLYFNDEGKTSTEIKKSLLSQNRQAKGENIDFDSKRGSFSLDYEYRASNSLTLYSNIFKTKYERNFLQNDTRDFSIPKFTSNMPFLPLIKNLKSTLDGKFIEESQGIKLKSKFDYDSGTLVMGYDYTTTNVKRDSLVTTDRFKFSDVSIDNFPIPPNLLGTLEGIVTIKNSFDISKDTHALYLLNNYNLTEKLALTTGLRYEYSKYNGYRNSFGNIKGYNLENGGILGGILFPNNNSNKILINDYTAIDKSTDNFAGEIGLNYKFSEVGSIYTRYERGFISPLPSQLTNKENQKYTNSNLKSETIDSIEFGIKDVIDNSFITASIFFSQTNNEIATLDRNANNPALKEWKFENIGQTRRYGSEIFAQHYFDKLTLSESITYIDAKIKKVNSNEWLKEGDKVPIVSKWKITLGADYNFNDKFSLGATYVYNSGYEKRELESYNKYKISGFGVTDLYGKYNIKDYLTVKIGVNNIFNEHYNYFETATTAIPAPERNYYLGLSLKF